jgi:undecaprenyl diphosphate synthase
MATDAGRRRAGLPRVEGHRAGARRCGKTVRAAGDMGIRWPHHFSFSFENWQRPASECAT